MVRSAAMSGYERAILPSDLPQLSAARLSTRETRPAEVAPGAKLASPIEFTQHKRGPDRASPRYYWHQALRWGASFVFGLVLLLIAPGFFYDVTNACKKVASACGIGVLFLLALPVVAILVCITIVGIPVGITALFLYVIALYSTQVFVGAWLGEKILGAAVGFGPTARKARSGSCYHPDSCV